MNVHTCSFASSGFVRQQGLQSAAFADIGFPRNRIYAHGVSILSSTFFDRFSQASELNRFGYYCFKPYFIEKVLSLIPRGDVLLYLDVNDCPLMGIIEYIQLKFTRQPKLNLLCAGTNYPNARHMSWYHHNRLAPELLLSSHLIFQPEAGALAVRNTEESRALLRAWFELTLVQALALLEKDDPESRGDQETLYLISRLNKSVQIESWLRYKLTGNGLRKFVDWEFFRHG